MPADEILLKSVDKKKFRPSVAPGNVNPLITKINNKMKLRSLISLCLAGASITAMAQGYKDGIEYYKADQFKNAKELLNRNINNADTDKAASYYYLGCISMQEGNLPEATSMFNKGVEANPENHLLMHAMGANVAGAIGSAIAAGILLALC